MVFSRSEDKKIHTLWKSLNRVNENLIIKQIQMRKIRNNFSEKGIM